MVRSVRIRKNDPEAAIFVASYPIRFEILIRVEGDEIYWDCPRSRCLQDILERPVFLGFEQAISRYKILVERRVSAVGQNYKRAASIHVPEFAAERAVDGPVEVCSAN